MSAGLSAPVERLSDELSGDSKLVFDLDGTLYDTRDFERPALASVVRWVRERSGRELPGAEQDLWHRRESDRHRPGLFDDFLRAQGLPAEWGRECAQRFHDYPGDELSASENLRPLLQRLRERGRSLALVTNGRMQLQERKLRLLGLIESFDALVYCDPRRPEELKPSTWAWNRLATWRAGAPATYVGDDPVDAAFATAGGASFVKFCFRSSAHDH